MAWGARRIGDGIRGSAWASWRQAIRPIPRKVGPVTGRDETNRRTRPQRRLITTQPVDNHGKPAVTGLRAEKPADPQGIPPPRRSRPWLSRTCSTFYETLSNAHDLDASQGDRRSLNQARLSGQVDRHRHLCGLASRRWPPHGRSVQGATPYPDVRRGRWQRLDEIARARRGMSTAGDHRPRFTMRTGTCRRSWRPTSRPSPSRLDVPSTGEPGSDRADRSPKPLGNGRPDQPLPPIVDDDTPAITRCGSHVRRR